jgi:phage head maturation protease
MNQFAKSRLTVDGNSVHVSMPFAKVDVSKRTVSGYATLDNMDTQGDVVTAEASKKAFERARGNLREMHDKIAVGRIIDFKENEFLDKNSGELYRGIYVTAYVSKGAESTWEKVLDGTLSGFSIGGEIIDASTEFVKEAGRSVRFVKEYDLTELSLVDNPANQLANVESFTKNIFSISKVADGSVNVEGMVAETVIESVFMCKNDDTIIVKAAEKAPCPVCDIQMENIGWFESGTDRAEKVRTLVNKFLSPSEEAAPSSEGGVEMAKKETSINEHETTATTADATNPAAQEEASPHANEVVDETEGTEEESGEVEEVEDEETAISKKIDELKDTVTEALASSKKETLEQIAALEKRLDEVHETLGSKTSELESKLSEFGEGLAAHKARLAEFEKTLGAVNKSAATKKSADVESTEPVQKSRTFQWGTGTFSGESLFK